jgi:flotillin
VRGGTEAFAAEAYRTRTLAEAERDQTRFAAEAYHTRALAEAQAEAIRARADSLREGNAELIAANRLVEILLSLVEAAARGLAESNLTVLNGTQGVNEVVAGNGAAPVAVPAVARADL